VTERGGNGAGEEWKINGGRWMVKVERKREREHLECPNLEHGKGDDRGEGMEEQWD